MKNEDLYLEGTPDFICTGCEILLNGYSVPEYVCGEVTCPICGSDIVPCGNCVCCGEIFGIDELSNGFCKTCDESLEKRA